MNLAETIYQKSLDLSEEKAIEVIDFLKNLSVTGYVPRHHRYVDGNNVAIHETLRTGLQTPSGTREECF